MNEMFSLQIRAVLAGVFFGLWPLFMNRSGLNGNVSSACFGLAALAFVFPFSVYSSGLTIPSANWTMVALAGLFGALGLLAFNSVLAGVSPQNVGTLFVLMMVVQVIVPASYQIIINGGHVSIDKVGGFVAVLAGVYLLLR